MKRKRKHGKCKCGSTEHSSVYDTTCELYIPLESRPTTTTVSVSALGRLNYPEYGEVVVEAANTASMITCRAMWLLHCYFLFLLNRGDASIPEAGERIVRDAIWCVSDTGGRLKALPPDDLLHVYNGVFGSTPRIKSKGLGSVLTYAVNNIVTVIGNFDTCALDDHVAMYLRAKYNIKRGHGTWLAGNVCRLTGPGQIRTLPKTLDGTVEEWQAVINDEQARYTQAKTEGTGKVMEYRYHMLREIESAEQRHNEEFKRFAILPLLSEGVQFVTLDNRGLQFLAALAKERFPHHDKDVITEIFSSVDTFFDRTKGIKKKPNHQLAPIVRTNGVELHVMFEKNVRRMKSGKSCKLKAEEKTLPEHLDPSYDMAEVRGHFKGFIEEGQIVGVDPGNANPYTAVRPVPGKHQDGMRFFESRTVSKATYNLKSKRNKVKKRAERDRKRFGVHHIIDELSTNSFKTPHFDDVMRATQVRLRHHRVMHEVQSNKQKLKLKFEARIAEQREIDNIIKDLTFDYTAKLVVIGDGSRMSGMRGTTCGVANSKIKRKMVKVGKQRGFFVKSANEAYTSKHSWCCRGREMKNMKTSHKTYTDSHGVERPTAVHGLNICTGCNKVWSRDINGAINIWYVGSRAFHGMERPWWLNADTSSGAHLNIAPGTAGQA